MTNEFDDIRSYRDHETKEVCQRLLGNEKVISILTQLLPGFKPKMADSLISKIETIYEFQHELMLPIFEKNIRYTFTQLTSSGLESLDKNKAHLFISNHRDIVLDSAILNYFLHVNGFSTAEIAIGDNLLKEKWIEDLVRLNKSFIVKRGLDNMSMLKASQKMSHYIKDSIQNRNESVWIAQRAGRAKDGNDETNKGLISMFGMSAGEDLRQHYKDLNIVPVTVSYEFDPCDDRKTKELYFEKVKGEYQKSESEDVESMKLGITLPKGKGHIHFGDPLNEDIDKIESGPKKSVFTQGLSELIDASIQSKYRTWSSNHIAHELITGKDESDYYTKSEKAEFENRINSIVDMIEGDENEIRSILLGMYDQPLTNKRKRGEILLDS